MAGNQMNGDAIRRLGISTYMKHRNSADIANIDIFANSQQLQRRWNECNFGCHHPGYRVLARQITYSEFINSLGPIVGGLVDGIASELNEYGEGAERVAQWYSSSKHRARINHENTLIFNLIKTALEKLFTMDLSLVDNPLTELIIRIVENYLSQVPDEVWEKIIESGKLTIDNVDTAMVNDAIKKGLSGLATNETIDAFADDMKNRAAKMASKWVGRQIARRIAILIAIQIAHTIITTLTRSPVYKNFLKVKNLAKKPGGLATVISFLLRVHGKFQIASEASARLRFRCPRLWMVLRDNKNTPGMDLLYFLAEDYISEHVDRISLAEKNPVMFLMMVNALLKEPGGINNLLYPFHNTKTKPIPASVAPQFPVSGYKAK